MKRVKIWKVKRRLKRVGNQIIVEETVRRLQNSNTKKETCDLPLSDSRTVFEIERFYNYLKKIATANLNLFAIFVTELPGGYQSMSSWFVAYTVSPVTICPSSVKNPRLP